MRITQPDFLHLISEEHLRPGDALHLYTADSLQPDLLVTADLNNLVNMRTGGPHVSVYGSTGTHFSFDQHSLRDAVCMRW